MCRDFLAAMADSGYERVVCVKNEVFVYKIPARTSNRGYRRRFTENINRVTEQGRAAEWNLDQPAWTGRMRCVASDKILQVKLEDRNSGELFAMCPVETYPSNAVEQVLDSSRYFVIQIQDTTGRHAFIGIGFADRADSFDLLVTMQDHFKWLKREEKEKHEANKPEDTGPKLDLSFKEGQTIKINIGGSGGEARKSRPRNNAGGGLGLLPPPPGGVKLPGPPRAAGVVLAPPPSAPTSQPVAPPSAATGADLDFLDSSLGQPAAKPADPWGDFASAGSTNTSAQAAAPPSGNWVQF